ncbi:autotransporter outer membrane beta-barrel domain-containing protein [Anaeromusa acidaminophila]|uniref:autotransporter outer membrane beta-barrel domain-containing protein n=1 Tax=Anaeromusa acidaminophila TaxID=81464 RepID=UPI000372714F|nr:autotransporter outer membrane beta-barrel domain-containing protein [Anaeromusa acidaminophila]
MRKIKRALQKKAAFWAALSLAALLLMPQAAEAGETRTYTGDGSLLQVIDGRANSFGPADLANVSGNTISVDYSSGTDPNYVFGAFSNSVGVSSNTVVITSGSVSNSVFGGESTWGDCADNRVIISKGSVSYPVYGGSSAYGECVGNSVIVNGGSARAVVGGHSQEKSAANNSATINGGLVNDGVAGGTSILGDAIGNTVTVNGGKIENAQSGFSGGNASVHGNSMGNKVTINGGIVDLCVEGGTSAYGSATGNSVVISGGSVGGDIYGGRAYRDSATGNSVTISGTPTLNGILYGGYKDSGNGDIWTGNTLNVKTSGMSAKGVANFQYYNFYLPVTLVAGGTMLSVIDAVVISGSTIGVGINGSTTALRSGDRVTLLSAGGGLTAGGINTRAVGLQGIARIYDFDLTTDASHLYATAVSEARSNPQVKALSEGQASTAAFLNQGADMLTGQGLQNARGASTGSGGQLAGFAAFGGSSLRYETGSHVDVNGFSLVVGAASEKENAQGTFARGLFVEHGWGSYSTYNSFSNAASVKGDGDTQYTGAGWLGRWQKKSGQYLEGSLRAGRVSNKFSSGDIGAAGTNSSFDVSAPYYGLHIGLGQETDLGNHKKRDIYAKVLWTHQNGSNATVQGDNFRFDAVESLRVQAGTKWLHKTNENTTLRAGLAYQYELGGQADATVNGSAVEAPSLKGGTGILEVGLTKESKDGKGPTLDFGLQGFCGKARGVAGTMQASWKF